MVSNITSLSGSGLKDWFIQRVTAIYFGVYSVYLLGFLMLHPSMTYSQWSSLFGCIGFQMMSVIALSAISMHAWVGLWTVTTDYIKCTTLRVSVQLGVFFWLLCQYIWGLMIVWRL